MFINGKFLTESLNEIKIKEDETENIEPSSLAIIFLISLIQ